MRALIAGIAVVGAVTAPAADTGTADLAISHLSATVHGNRVTVHAEGRNWGPDVSEPGVLVTATPGTVERVVCTANHKRFFDASDGTTCEVMANLLKGRAGEIQTFHAPAGIVTVTARIYDLEGNADSSPADNYRTIKVRVR